MTAAAWAHATAAAEKWNQPGVFTTLHGFEWTSAPGGKNLHRTVIFRDGADRVSQVVPFSTFDSQDPADLWKYMDAYAKKTGGQVLAIPHNGNLSMGIMYSAETFDGKPMDRAYAEVRARHEPLFEATQIKGDGETHPYLSPNDEFADFERWWSVDVQKMEKAPNSVLQGNYVRSALKLGLELEARLGANPYKAGLIGGNDAHIGVVTTREDNFYGEFANGLPSPERWKTPLMMIHNDPKQEPLVSVWGEQAAGLGGVWARENTREGIWDALKRREVYATTGDRPVVRVFAGWEFVPADLNRSDFAENGYKKGVPMGGDLSKAPATSDRSSWSCAARIRRAPTSTASRSSRAGSTRPASSKKIFDVAVVRRPHDRRRMARCRRRSATRWTSKTRPTRTPSAPRNSRRLDGSRFQARRARLLLCPCDPDPDAALEHLRSEASGKDARLRPMTVTDRAYTSPIWYTPGARDLITPIHVNRLLREPLLHFLLLGAALFHRLRPDVQTRQQCTRKDRRDNGPGRAPGDRLYEDLAATADRRRARGADRRLGSRGDRDTRSDGARSRQGRHRHPPPPAAEAGVRVR